MESNDDIFIEFDVFFQGDKSESSPPVDRREFGLIYSENHINQAEIHLTKMILRM